MMRASAFLRLFAFIVDILFLLVVQVLLFTAAFLGHVLWLESSSLLLLIERLGEFSIVLSLSFLFVVLYYFTYLTADGEQTIGKSICRIRVVTKDGDDLGRIRAFLRCICYGFSTLPLLLGFLMAFLFRGHALHDILCGTMVIKVTDGG